MDQGRTYSCRKIEEQKFVLPPHLLQRGAKGPKGVHIEQDVHKATVHEHMGDDLPESKILIFGKPEGEPLVHLLPVQGCSDKKEDVYDQKMLDRTGKSSHLGEFFIDFIFG